MVKGGLVSLFWIACWIFAQILIFHWTNRRMFRTMTYLFLLTLPAYVASYLLTSPTLGFLPQGLTQTPFLLGLWNGLGLHLLLCLTYLACFYYVDRPVTLRMLQEFLKAPKGELTLSQLKAVYGLRNMIGRRLEGMKEGGLVLEQEGRYSLTPKGQILGRIFHVGKGLLRLDRTQKR